MSKKIKNVLKMIYNMFEIRRGEKNECKSCTNNRFKQRS